MLSIHRSLDGFDTGLELNLPQKYIFIPLDVFRKIAYTIDSELDAWLLFLSSGEAEDIAMIISKYPFFAEIYEEMAEFQKKPEELIGMYSKMLEIMDRNTVQYMIDEQKEEIEQLRDESERLKQKNEAMQQKNEAMQQEKDAEIARLKALLSQQQN